jgi:hypothetical protein
MTAEEVTALLAVAKANWPRTEVTPAMVALWSGMLGDLGVAEATAAMHAHIAESQWWPTIADIRGRAARAAVGAPAPEEALAEMVRGISKFGRARSPKWSHPAIEATVDAMGWVSICDSPADLIAVRARFLELYDSAAKTAERRENVGRLEAHRRGEALPIGSVVKMIGGR